MSDDLKHILLVEDSPDDALVIQRYLSKSSMTGLKVTHKTRLDEACSQLNTENREYLPDIILLDLNLPDAKSLEGLTRLRQINPDIPIIILSGVETEEIAIGAIRENAQDYLIKSDFNPRTLSRAIFYAEERQKQQLQIQKLLTMNTEGILVVNNNKSILYANPASAVLFGCEVEQLQGTKFSLPVPDKKSIEVSLDDNRSVSLNSAPIVWYGKNAHLISLHDISDQKKNEATLTRMAQFDHLTKLPNRSLFQKLLKKSLARSKRRGDHTAVLFIDLDLFKEINDSLGHAAGDSLLKSVAQRLEGSIRSSDSAARLGGDEFALILDGLSQPEDAGRVAQKVLNALAAPHNLENETAQVGCSIGIAIYPDCGTSPEQLLKSADTAMYHAKSQGRNNYQFFCCSNPDQTDQESSA